MGIGPTQPAWKAGALPLSYTRIGILANALLVYMNTFALSNIFNQFIDVFYFLELIFSFAHYKMALTNSSALNGNKSSIFSPTPT